MKQQDETSNYRNCHLLIYYVINSHVSNQFLRIGISEYFIYQMM